MRKHKKKCRHVCGSSGLRKGYDVVNREVLWQVLRMYDVSCEKLLNRIKSMFVNSLA